MKRALTLGRWCIALIIFGVVLEVCARLDDVVSYGANFWGPYNNEILFQRDSIGKWGKPGARYAKWQLNSMGYRGPELRPGTTRIVCIGASETFGLYEAPGEEYPRQLERDLNSGMLAAPFQVVNVAYAGETVPTAILRVPQIVEEIHPSYATIYPDLASYIWMFVKHEKPAASKSAQASRYRISFDLRLASRVENLLKEALPSAIQNELRKISMRREIAAGHYVVMERLPQERVERFRQDLKELIATLRAHGVEPVLVTPATVFSNPLSESDREALTTWRKIYPMLKEEGFLDMVSRMNEVIRETAADEHVPLIDADKEMPRGPKYFADMVHFTTPGAGVMARILAEGLKPLLNSQSQKVANGAEQVRSANGELHPAGLRRR
jgi:lysophospholipase L1-like esterase